MVASFVSKSGHVATSTYSARKSNSINIEKESNSNSSQSSTRLNDEEEAEKLNLIQSNLCS